MRGKIDSMITLSNQVYTNSGILTKLNLTFAYRQLNYTWDYQTKCEDAIYHITSPTDGYMDDVHEYRLMYKADLVQLITVPCSYCGIAWPGYPNPLVAKAFFVITTDCMDLSSTNEIGHDIHGKAKNSYS